MDSVFIAERIIEGENTILAVICDGVGSSDKGAEAAAYTVCVLKDWFSELNGTERLGLRLRDCIVDINSKLAEAYNTERIQAASTVSAFLVYAQNYFLIHVGDSRIYMFDKAELVQLTTDQTENGKLLQYLGQNRELIPQYGEGSFSGGTILLCSDGFYRRLDPQLAMELLIKTNLKTMKSTMTRAVNAMIERGETDNISLAVLKTES